MTTDNPSSVPAQRSQYNSLQSAQVSVTDACHCLGFSLLYISIQASGGLDQLLGVDPAGPYPVMRHVSMGYDGPPHLPTVSVR
jgi:hypothetical protein